MTQCNRREKLRLPPLTEELPSDAAEQGDQDVTEEREATTPSEEWGDRIATGRAIARGGKNTGHVPGASA